MAGDEHEEDNYDESDEEEIDKMIDEGREIELRDDIEVRYKPLTAHDLLTKSESEIKEIKKEQEKEGKRETHGVLKDLKIITAIMLGKKSNKELSQVLDTDKSFTSKQIKHLEEKGLVHKTGEGKKTQYEVNEFNVMKFLTSKIVLKWDKKEKQEEKKDEQ